MATQKDVDVVIAAVKAKMLQHGLGMALPYIKDDQFADIAQYVVEELDDSRKGGKT